MVLQSQQIEKVKHRTLIWVKKKKQAFSTDMIFIFYHSISAGSRLWLEFPLTTKIKKNDLQYYWRESDAKIVYKQEHEKRKLI